MTLTALTLALTLAPSAHAGPEPYTEEEAMENAPVVVVAEALETTCEGWIEFDGDYVSYEARYETTLEVIEVFKGDYAPGDIISVPFTEVVGETGEMSCGWFDAPLHPGLLAQLYLYELEADRLRQLDFATPIVIDDSDLEDLPDCAPTEEPEEPEEPEKPEDLTGDEEEDLDDSTEDDISWANDEKDEEAKSGCQVVAAPTSLTALMPVLLMLGTLRRRR